MHPTGPAPTTPRPSAWIAAHLVGAAALLWVAIANGYPMLFADSGGYLRIGTQFFFPTDRPVSYGLLIAPLARLSLWAIVVAQALFAAWMVGEVLAAVSGRRSPAMLVAVLAALAAFSSLPWFAGQVMPDLFTPLMALTLFLLLFAPGRGLRRWWLAALLAGQVALHLSHVPIAAGLILVGGALLLRQDGWRTALRRVAPAAGALLLAVLGLCTINLAAAGQFRPSLQSGQFLVARTLDGRVGQPVLARLCARESQLLCEARGFVDDPRRALPGQDYLWAADSPRPALERRDPARFRAEESAFAGRVLREDPAGLLAMAMRGWRDQLLRARAADGLVAYGPGMQAVQQISRHFPEDRARFAASRQQRGTLQALAAVPERAIALCLALALPLVFWVAMGRRNRRLCALAVLVTATLLGNAAVCGILSGPADRYQSRVLWLLALLAATTLASARRPEREGERAEA